MRVRISSAAIDLVTRLAQGSRWEVCGLLYGAEDRIDAAELCRNVAVDAAHRFEIDPACLLAAHRAARGGGPRIAGCFHSHPSGRAEPSARDAADAAPDGLLWLIVGDGAVTLWRAVPNGERFGRFDPVRFDRTA